MNELKAMFLQLWEGLSGPRKLSFISTTLLAFAVLGAIIYFSSQPKLTLLYSGLSSGEAAKIVEYLEGKKIKYEIGDGGGSIFVPAHSVHSTRLALAAQGIPRTSDTAGGVGFEIFDRPTFGMSDFMQKANYYRALQGELARTIKQMEEVSEARVMIVVPEERLFSRKPKESKASVFLRLKPGSSLSEAQVQAVRFLTANGVQGLQPNRVTVVDSAGRALATDEGTGISGSLNNRQQEIVRETENHLQNKAQSMLDQVLGPGQSVVRVSAELDFNTAEQTSETYDPKGAVVRSETISSETNNSQTQGSSGTVGTASNLGEDNEEQAASLTKSEQQRDNTTNQYEINRVVEKKQIPSGSIKRLTVALFVNTRKSGSGNEKNSIARTPQELKSLEEIVKAAVGFTQEDTRNDVIQVQEVEFADMFETTSDEDTGAQVMQQMDRWLPYASQGFLILLAVGLLFYFKGLLKGNEVAGTGNGGQFDELISRYETVAEGVKNRSKKENERGGEALSAEEISKLINENPTNTAQALKQWMGRN